MVLLVASTHFETPPPGSMEAASGTRNAHQAAWHVQSRRETQACSATRWRGRWSAGAGPGCRGTEEEGGPVEQQQRADRHPSPSCFVLWLAVDVGGRWLSIKRPPLSGGLLRVSLTRAARVEASSPRRVVQYVERGANCTTAAAAGTTSTEGQNRITVRRCSVTVHVQYYCALCSITAVE